MKNDIWPCIRWLICLGLLVASPRVWGLTSGDFLYTVTSNKVTITGYAGPGGALTLPDTIAGNPVTSIGDTAFVGCSGLTSVTLPSGVTSIGNYAFYTCSGLTSVTIPSGVTSIGDGAFVNCTGLTSLTLPSSVTSIGNSAFAGCTGLTSVTLPSGVTSIGPLAFNNCSGLTSVTLSSSVTSIGNSAFMGCTGLTSVTIPSSVTSIGTTAFAGCTGLTSVTLPSGVTSIGYSAFAFCSGLSSLAIPSSVTSIGNSAFMGCTGLTSMTIPSGVTSIGDLAFFECTGLARVNCLGNAPSVGGNAFFSVPGSIYYVNGTTGWGATYAGRPTVAVDLPVITWATPSAIVYGTALSGTQLNATASVAGTFVYNPASGSTPAAGTQTLSMTFTPTDSAHYTPAIGSVSLTVGKAAPVITWATPAAITSGTALSGAQLNATASVAGTFAYNPAAGATPAAGVQTLGVAFTPTDTASYTTATASVTLAVGALPTPPVITAVVVGHEQAIVSFTVPSNDGGLAITVYTVTATPTGLTPTSGTLRALATRGKGPVVAATAGTVVVTGTSAPITVTGLVDGVTYRFAVTAANSLGASPPSAPSDPVIVGAAPPTRLSNMSVRIGAGTGDRTLIVGFVVGGAGTSGTKPLLVRAVGPTLASYGVTGTLADPSLALIPQGASTALATNDNWAGDAQLTAVGNTVGAFPLSSAASKDAALYLTPAKGAYTVQVTGVGGAEGIALAEIYDASGADGTASTPRLINVSARAQVGTGDGVLIAGFVVEGTASRTVLIRAVGPTLG
ncbi:MAG: fibronectin type III domain-containing protein, partial [Verrucomicrobiota bacterium]